MKNDDILEQRVPACADSAVCLKRCTLFAAAAGRRWEAGRRHDRHHCAPYCQPALLIRDLQGHILLLSMLG